MLLKKVPEAVDSNPAKIIFGLARIALQIKDVRRYSPHNDVANFHAS
jgi:hypothetical protein